LHAAAAGDGIYTARSIEYCRISFCCLLRAGALLQPRVTRGSRRRTIPSAGRGQVRTRTKGNIMLIQEKNTKRARSPVCRGYDELRGRPQDRYWPFVTIKKHYEVVFFFYIVIYPYNMQRIPIILIRI